MSPDDMLRAYAAKHVSTISASPSPLSAVRTAEVMPSLKDTGMLVLYKQPDCAGGNEGRAQSPALIRAGPEMKMKNGPRGQAGTPHGRFLFLVYIFRVLRTVLGLAHLHLPHLDWLLDPTFDSSIIVNPRLASLIHRVPFSIHLPPASRPTPTLPMLLLPYHITTPDSIFFVLLSGTHPGAVRSLPHPLLP
ncbi:hypothetical protein B0H19DRAFT_1277026 [Mycena capillaripes]|nr:hypothetical protein B0H19DRAFT_1277026 [Mycena capillaripes]